MSHSYTNLLNHIVYSTKNRKPFIASSLQSRLFPYFGGIVRQLVGKLYVVNGVEDHVHLLAELPVNCSGRSDREDQGKLDALDPRIIPRSIRVRVAARLRRIQ